MKKFCIPAILALPAACIAISFSSSLRPFLQIQQQKTVSLQTLSPQNLHAGDYVAGSLENTDGYIAEQTVQNTVFGFSSAERPMNRYYVFTLADGTLMLYETGSPQEYEQLGSLADSCEQYHDALLETAEREGNNADLRSVRKPELSVPVSGIIRNMPDNLRNIFSEWYGKVYTGHFSAGCETGCMLVQTDEAAIRRGVRICGFSTLLACVLLAAAAVLHHNEKKNQQ